MRKGILSAGIIAGLVVAIAAVTSTGVTKAAEDNTVIGTFTDKKDFMFTVEDAEGNAYGFGFENGNAPEGYENLKDGDQVTVKYTGEINEVDAFEGTIISVTK